MKDNKNVVSNSETWKNLVVGGLVGGMLGVIFGANYGSIPLGLVIGILFGLAFAYRVKLPMKMRYPAYIIRRMLLAGAFFFLVSAGYMTLLDHGWTGMRAILAGLVAAVAWGVLVVVIALAIGSLDELQRRIQTEAIAIGFAGTAIVVLGYGLLGLAGVVQLNWGLAVLVMLPMWLIGKLWTMWRYR